ncbi:MAG TPA: cyclopropane-fatty-acyl-phospholipid synthase family protein [Rhodoblastus sp.]|nr:cyclopropane-fatty-acyl-phospholipid synthase family protein [Rhodoblastus sp.]
MKRLLAALASRIVRRGNLQIEYVDGSKQSFGDGEGPPIAIRFTDDRGPFDLARNPELTLGELYMDGRLVMTSGTILDFLRLVMSNAVRRTPPLPMRAIWLTRRLASTLWRNGRGRARANVAHHYDLDGRLYDLFLDRDRQYSCAYFEQPGMSLDAAQLAKKRHVAAKLLMEPGQRTLDIGSGWGGMALYLARHCGADVTGITLSTEQLAMSADRARAGGLSDRVRFKLEDYRDTQGPFDRIVSVGMFEHVGAAHYDGFFAKMAELLTEDGVALLHTIGRPDGPGATNAWIAKYIFPGGYIPSLSEIAASVEKAGLFITDVEVLRLHYAETLKAWRERFLARREEAKALYDERFCRMWEFYLSISELTFRIEGECVFQVQIARRHDKVPITRGYIAAREDALRKLDAGDLDEDWRATAAQ